MLWTLIQGKYPIRKRETVFLIVLNFEQQLWNFLVSDRIFFLQVAGGSPKGVAGRLADALTAGGQKPPVSMTW